VSQAVRLEPGYTGDMNSSKGERAIGRHRPGTLACWVAVTIAAWGCSQGGAGHTDSAVPSQPDGDDSGGDVAPPSTVMVSSSFLDFGAIDLGSSSVAKVVVLTVSGSPIVFTPAVVGAGFTLTETTCSNPQSAGTCTLSVTFTPTTVGGAEGVLRVGLASVALSGTATGGSFTQPEVIDLGTVAVGQAVPVVLQVAANPSVTGLACVAASADLTIAGTTCPASGTVTGACTFTFTFQSSTTGTKSDSIVCTRGGKAVPTLVAATVVLPADPRLYPPAGTFVASIGGVDTVTFTLSNAGGSPTGLLSASLGDDASDFSIVSNDCAVPLAPLDSCKIQVAFKPSTNAQSAATLVVTDDSPASSPVIAPLTSIRLGGPGPALGPVDFGDVSVATAKATTVDLKNSGATALPGLSLASSSPAFTLDPGTCANGVPAGDSCTFTITFTPSDLGAQTSVITVALPDGGLVATAKVAGVGVVPSTPGLPSDTPPP
jgi:hypothetical protein